eukprot:SAG31_NODE_2154_length_6312_cov_3.684050_7_plen_632_part_00
MRVQTLAGNYTLLPGGHEGRTPGEIGSAGYGENLSSTTHHRSGLTGRLVRNTATVFKDGSSGKNSRKSYGNSLSWRSTIRSRRTGERSVPFAQSRRDDEVQPKSPLHLRRIAAEEAVRQANETRRTEKQLSAEWGGICPSVTEQDEMVRLATSAQKSISDSKAKGWRKRLRGLPLPGLFEAQARQPLSETRDPGSKIIGWTERGESFTVSALRWAGFPPVGRARTKHGWLSLTSPAVVEEMRTQLDAQNGESMQPQQLLIRLGPLPTASEEAWLHDQKAGLHELETRLVALQPLKLKREQAAATANRQLKMIRHEQAMKQRELESMACFQTRRQKQLNASIAQLEKRAADASAQFERISKSSQVEKKLAIEISQAKSLIGPVQRRVQAAADIQAASKAEAEHSDALAELARRVGVTRRDRLRQQPAQLTLDLDANVGDTGGNSCSVGRRQAAMERWHVAASPGQDTGSPLESTSQDSQKLRRPAVAGLSPITNASSLSSPGANLRRRQAVVGSIQPDLGMQTGLGEVRTLRLPAAFLHMRLQPIGFHHAGFIRNEQALRVARSYPGDLFEAVLEKELHKYQLKSAQAAAEKSHEAMMEKFKTNGRLAYELAHDGLCACPIMPRGCTAHYVR